MDEDILQSEFFGPEWFTRTFDVATLVCVVLLMFVRIPGQIDHDLDTGFFTKQAELFEPRNPSTAPVVFTRDGGEAIGKIIGASVGISMICWYSNSVPCSLITPY